MLRSLLLNLCGWKFCDLNPYDVNYYSRAKTICKRGAWRKAVMLRLLVLWIGLWIGLHNYHKLPEAKRCGQGFILFFHTLAVILGASIGEALKIGLLANNYVFLAILGSGGLLYFLIVRSYLRSKSLIADFKEKDRDLISLS